MQKIMADSKTTPEQARVLRFLAQYPKWHAFVELDQIRLLETDDVLCVPSLVKRGWVEHRVSAGRVRITPVGQVIAGEDAESHG
jgi:hypothetical protein